MDNTKIIKGLNTLQANCSNQEYREVLKEAMWKIFTLEKKIKDIEKAASTYEEQSKMYSALPDMAKYCSTIAIGLREAVKIINE